MTTLDVIDGDCLQEMRRMEAGSFDLVCTDPPFSSGTRKEADKGGVRKSTMLRGDRAWFGSDALTTNGFVWLMRECAVEWRRLLRPGGSVLCFIDWRMNAALSGAIESADLRAAGLIVWDKAHFGMGNGFRNQHEFVLHFSRGPLREPLRRDVGNVLRCPAVKNGAHPTEKPIPLLRDLMSVLLPAGGRALDPFCGSAPVLIAAHGLGASAVGVERDPVHLATARRRVAAVLGRGARLREPEGERDEDGEPPTGADGRLGDG